MPFVEDLPHIELTLEQEDRLRNYLFDELTRAESERQGHIDGLKEEIDAYEALPARGKATPWEGAASITVPVIASMVDATFPRLHSTVFGATTVISVEELLGEFAHHVKAWEDGLNWSMNNELEIASVANDWILETVIHGTGIVKLGWERVEREVLRYNDDGDMTEKQLEVLINQPVLRHVSQEDFYVPYTANSIPRAPWCGERLRELWGDIKIKEESGLYKNIEALQNSTEIDSPEYEHHREGIEDRVPEWNDEYEIFELWVDFDLEGDGLPQPLLVNYHWKSNTLLRVQAHPYNHGKKPYFKIVYFPRHDRFYGVGLARQLLPIQEEITAIHRQRLDNGTVANSRMWKVVSGSRADQSFEGVAPGLKIKVDSLDEIDALPIGDVSPSSFENENMALRYAQQRSGISDFMMGTDVGQAGGRQTATQIVTMLQEARTRFNWTLDQIRAALVGIAEMTTDLYQQYGGDAIERFGAILGDEKAQLIQELLATESAASSTRVNAIMKLQVTASSASVNRAVEQQNLIGLLQLIQQITSQFEMPLVQLALNPQAPPQLREYALSKLEGMRALERRILEVNDVRNTAEILGNTEGIREATESISAAAGGLAEPGGAGAVEIPGPYQGLAGFGEGTA